MSVSEEEINKNKRENNMIPYETKVHPAQTKLHYFAQTTSKQAYKELTEEGVILSQEADYLELLRNSPEGLTDAEAANILLIPCSTVSARRNGIMEKHNKYVDEHGGNQLIVQVGTRKNKSGRKAIIWGLTQWRG